MKDDRVIRATIGLSTSEFNQRVQRFAQEIEKEEWFRYERGIEEGNRERQPRGGRKDTFYDKAMLISCGL